MKKFTLLFTALICVLGLSAQERINLAYFPFSQIEASPNTATVIFAEAGAQSGESALYMNGTNGSSSFDQATELNRFNGSTENSISGFSQYYDLAIVGPSANGKALVFKISTQGFQDLVISYAYRRSATGFNSCEWSYSVNGTDYTVVETKTYAESISPSQTETVDLSGIDALEDQENVYLKLILTGCSSTSANGNNRFGNVQFNAYPAGPDIYPPYITSATAVDSNKIQIVFNEALDSLTAVETDNYTLDGGREVVAAQLLYGNMVNLTVSPVFSDGTTCQVVVENVSDLEGNVMNPDTVYVEYGINPEFQCNDIATLRTKLDYSNINARVVGTVEYRLNNSVIITAKAAYNNQKYIQDETGAILIFDENNILDPNNGLEVGDKIKGLYGTLTNYYGFLEFVPTRVYTTHEAIMQTVEPLTITLAQLNDTAFMSAHQAELIKLEGAAITSTGTFAKLNRYDVAQNGVSAPALYPYFQDVNYLTLTIPTNVNQTITGVNIATGKIGSDYFDFRYYIVPRSKDDMTAMATGIVDLGKQQISVYPNPTTDFITVNVENATMAEIFDLNGKKVASQSIGNNATISMLNFANGAYILRILNDGEVIGSTKIIKR